MKITILGIGGIGGLVGAALAKNYSDIYFIARGEALTAIKANGFTLESDKLGTFTVNPALVTDTPGEIGVTDVLIISTKSYSLEDACKLCAPIVSDSTLVIPLLNGIDVGVDTKAFLNGKGDVAEGCIYGFSSKIAPGKTKHIGDLCQIDFGFKDGHKSQSAITLAQMLNNSGITTTFDQNIMASAWKKYIMMCGNSCVFSYFESPAGEVRNDPAKYKFIKDVYTELFNIALATGIVLPETLITSHMEVFDNLPNDAITSLYRDLKVPSNKTEFEAVIGKGAKLAKEFGVKAPCLSAAYQKYKGR